MERSWQSVSRRMGIAMSQGELFERILGQSNDGVPHRHSRREHCPASLKFCLDTLLAELLVNLYGRIWLGAKKGCPTKAGHPRMSILAYTR